MLAEAVVTEKKAGRKLVKQLRRAGVKKVVVTKRASRKALRAVARGEGIKKAGLRRAVKKRLVTSVKAARRDILAAARETKPRRINVLAALKRGERTAVLRRDAAAVTLADLQLILERLQTDRRVATSARERQDALVTAAWACDGGTAGALRALAAHARQRSSGLGKQGGALVAHVATTLARRGADQGRGCA